MFDRQQLNIFTTKPSMVQVNTLYHDSTLVSQICVALIIESPKKINFFSLNVIRNVSLGFTWV